MENHFAGNLAKIAYTFQANVWQHASPGGWYFVSLPLEVGSEIRSHSGWQEEGWGRLKSTAKIGDSIWKTAIWFDTKLNTYLLPLKAMVRTKERIELDQKIEITLWI